MTYVQGPLMYVWHLDHHRVHLTVDSPIISPRKDLQTMSGSIVRFLCTYNGDNYLISIDRAIIDYQNLLSKVQERFRSVIVSSIKYKLRSYGQDLPVGIENDADVQNMMQAFPSSSEAIQLFISVAESTSASPSTKSGPRQDVTDGSVQAAQRDNTTMVDASGSIASELQCTLKVGQEFASRKAFDRALNLYFRESKMQYEQITLNSDQYLGKCVKNGCSWVVHAVKLPDRPAFKIESFQGKHTCKKSKAFMVESLRRKRTPKKNKAPLRQGPTVKLIANFIKHRDLYELKPKEIEEAAECEFGSGVNYHKARRAKIRATRERLYESFQSYFQKIETKNPGVVRTQSDSSCKGLRIFVGYNSAIQAFLSHCRPMLILEVTEIKGEYPYTWLYAMGVDGNNGRFLLASAVVENNEKEKKDSWVWFCSNLADSLASTQKTTILIDREEELQEVVSKCFPNAYYLYNPGKLIKAFHNKFNNVDLTDHFRMAIEANSKLVFRHRMKDIADISLEASKWISEIDHKHWAPLYSEDAGHEWLEFVIPHDSKDLMGNVTDLLSVSMMEQLHMKMMKIVYQRREKSSEWKTKLTPFHEDRLSIARFGAQSELLIEYSTTKSVVLSVDLKHTVDLQMQTCSCLQWQMEKLPCSHAILVIRRSGRDDFDYCNGCYKVAKYKETYAGLTYPLLDASLPVEESSRSPLADET